MQHDNAPAAGRPSPASLVSRAVAAGTPEMIAMEAMRATRARITGGGTADGPMGARAEAYFWGVIRRRAFQGAAPAVSRLLVMASLERELRVAGHDSEAIRRELLRIHGADGSPRGAAESPVHVFA